SDIFRGPDFVLLVRCTAAKGRALGAQYAALGSRHRGSQGVPSSIPIHHAKRSQLPARRDRRLPVLRPAVFVRAARDTPIHLALSSLSETFRRFRLSARAPKHAKAAARESQLGVQKAALESPAR